MWVMMIEMLDSTRTRTKWLLCEAHRNGTHFTSLNSEKKSKITITSRVGDDEMLDSTRTNFVEAARDFDGGSGNDLR